MNLQFITKKEENDMAYRSSSCVNGQTISVDESMLI